MRREVIRTAMAPKAVGPYEQAVVMGGWVFASGQIPLDPATGDLVEGDIAVQTRRVLDNLRGVLEAAGSSLDRAVKTTVYLADLADFPRMNEIYGEYFPTAKPARSTLQAAALPRGARIEIEVIAEA
jgi:2-iminobutanoate/2-iminopropanoate deaminase